MVSKSRHPLAPWAGLSPTRHTPTSAAAARARARAHYRLVHDTATPPAPAAAQTADRQTVTDTDRQRTQTAAPSQSVSQSGYRGISSDTCRMRCLHNVLTLRSLSLRVSVRSTSHQSVIPSCPVVSRGRPSSCAHGACRHRGRLGEPCATSSSLARSLTLAMSSASGRPP